jgi:hypothetical protein
MNHAKIAAALHALADAFLEGVETVEAAATGGKKGGKKTAAAEPAATQSAQPIQTLQPYVAPAPEPAAAPVPSITKDQLNKLVLKVAAKNRDTAEAILKRFGQANTVTLPQDQWQAVYDAFEEEIAKQDAAAVQVAQGSLV